MKNLREYIKKILRENFINEGQIWNQGGIILIRGGQRLYATSVKNLIEIKPGTKEKTQLGIPTIPAKDPATMAILSEDFYRIKYNDQGEVRAFKVGWKNEPSLAAMLNFKNHKLSIVLNSKTKTPLWRDTLQFNNIGKMLNTIKSQIISINNVDFYN